VGVDGFSYFLLIFSYFNFLPEPVQFQYALIVY
jgi:hypothetical protein